MAQAFYKQIIVGAGLSGGYAVKGIAEANVRGDILLVGTEPFLPYDRPALTKKLWSGKKTVEKIFAFTEGDFARQHADVKLGVTVSAIDAAQKIVSASDGHQYRYDKLLLATGGQPRRLSIPGGDLDGICYFRGLPDYLRMRAAARAATTAIVIGGGFIGSEIAAALTLQQAKVTMLFPDRYLVSRIFPEEMGLALTDQYRQRGVTVLSEDAPISIEREAGGDFLVRTKNGQQLSAELLIVGIGITPDIHLAETLGLALDNGIVVNEYLQSSNPDIYAAGDNARFPYQALGTSMRVEHWDNAVNQGRWAGGNMAGAAVPYDYMPYFYSDLFDFGYEAVGEIDSRSEIFADWTIPDHTGVIYYLQQSRVRGVMTCNIYGKLDQARELIRSNRQVTPDELRGAIRDEEKG